MTKKALFNPKKFLSLFLSTEYVYWLDRNNIYQGCNEKQAELFGLSSCSDIIGKKNCDLPWSENNLKTITFVDRVNLEVMTTGVPRVIEESIMLPSGTEVTFLSNKIPIRADDGNVIGLLAVSVDFTKLL